MEYTANFSANNGTTYGTLMHGCNKRKLLKEIREIALGNRNEGAHATWYVNDERGHTVYNGAYIPGVGIVYDIYNYKPNI